MSVIQAEGSSLGKQQVGVEIAAGRQPNRQLAGRLAGRGAVCGMRCAVHSIVLADAAQ